MKKVYIVGSVLFLASVFLVSVAHAAGPWYVATTGDDSHDCLSLATACLTIQAAVNKASSGDTINVEAGTYNQGSNMIIIDKSLTIAGPNASISPNSVSRVPEAIITGTAGGGPATFNVTLSTANVTFAGLKFSTTGAEMRSDSAGATITLSKNIFSGSMSDGMYFQDPNLIADDNLFKDIVTPNADTIQIGVSMPRVGAISITNNTWSNITESGALNLSDVKGSVSNNTFNGVQYYGVLVANNADLTISNNTFDNITNPTGGPTGDQLTWGAGIRFYQASSLTAASVAGNTFSNSYLGVSVRASDSNITGANIHVNRNAITGNTTAGILNAAVGALDANCNWWGAVSGPGPVGPGTGDKISTNVTASTWLTSVNLNSDCNGPLVITNPATDITPTSATVNGTNGTVNADDTSFWWGISAPDYSYIAAGVPLGLQPGWSNSDNGTEPAGASFNQGLTGLIPGTEYYFVAWSLVGGTWYPGAVLNFTTVAGPTPSAITNDATAITPTSATVNGTNGAVNADNTSFWLGTTPAGPFIPSTDPASEFPSSGWSHDNGLGTEPAGAPFSEPLTGLTPGTEYYFAAWSLVGGTWYPGAVLNFTTPPLPLTCPAGTTQNLVETVSVLANNSADTPSVSPLISGTNYILKAYGTANAGDGIEFDARYSYRTPTSVEWTDSVSTYESYGPTLLDLFFDGSTPWGSYNSSHEYQYLTTGDGFPASFKIYDTYYPNNTGDLKVDIYSCNPTTGSLTVEKEANGGNGTFNFTSDIPGGSSFSITTTGGAGYSQTYTNLTPGIYHVTEVNPTKGWTMIDNGCASVFVAAGAAPICIITNTSNKLLGVIRGTKYVDRDGNGTLKDGDHHRLSGVTIYLDTNNNSALDSGEPSTVTDSHGNYHFSGLVAGSYHVREVLQDGWIQTVPSGGVYNITLAAGKIAKKKNFGNFKPGVISGMKFNDLNGNGRKDSGDVGLPNWTINLKGPKGFTATTVTAADGSYSFIGLNAGTYTLSEVMQSTWTQTTHPGPVRIQSGTVSAKDNFGNTQKIIHGRDNQPWHWPWQQFGNDKNGHGR